MSRALIKPGFIYISNKKHTTLKWGPDYSPLKQQKAEFLWDPFNMLLTFYGFSVLCLWVNCPFKSHPAHPSGTQPRSTSSRCCRTCQNVLLLNSLTLSSANMGPAELFFQPLLLLSLSYPSVFSNSFLICSTFLPVSAFIKGLPSFTTACSSPLPPSPSLCPHLLFRHQ